MLHLRTQPNSNVIKSHASCRCIYCANATKIALFCFYAAAKLKPARFKHCLGKQDLCLNTFSIRFL